MWERRIENMNWKSLSKWREEYDGLAQTFEIAERPITSFSPNNFFTIFFFFEISLQPNGESDCGNRGDAHGDEFDDIQLLFC